MKWAIQIAAVLVFTALCHAGTSSAQIETEIAKIEAAASDSDLKVMLADAIAKQLGVHRNHIFRLRRETGQRYGDIYVSWLESHGHSEEAILEKIGQLNQRVLRSRPEPEQSGVHPAAYLSAGGGQSSNGPFYTVVPEFGLVSRRASLILGLPYYRFSGSASASGIGDVYATASIYGHARGLDLTPTVTIGFPTGDRLRALGAGKTTVDVSVAVAKRINSVQPFLRLGYANSIFNNVGYQRAYIADGKATYLTTGLDVRPLQRLTVGAGGFAMHPFGAQFVYSRSGANASTGTAPSGHMPPGMGMGWGGAVYLPVTRPVEPVATSGAELRDHGFSFWTSLRVARTVWLKGAAARSVSYHVTTVRAGIALDLFPYFERVGSWFSNSRHRQP